MNSNKKNVEEKLDELLELEEQEKVINESKKKKVLHGNYSKEKEV